MTGPVALVLSLLGLLALCLLLARQSAPASGLPWMLGTVALLVLGGFGVRQAAQGESRLARVLPAAFTITGASATMGMLENSAA